MAKLKQEVLVKNLSVNIDTLVPWWEKEKEFNQAKKVLIGLRVRFPGAKSGANDIGIIRDLFIQKPMEKVGRLIQPQVVTMVDFKSNNGYNYTRGMSYKKLVLVNDQIGNKQTIAYLKEVTDH